MKKELTYEYVFIQGDTDYYHSIMQRTRCNGDAIVQEGLFNVKCKIVKRILMVTYSIMHRLGFRKMKKILLPFMFRRKIHSKQVCFVIIAWYANDVKDYLGNYLRRRYKGCKIVCKFPDIIEKMPYSNLEYYRNSFDLLVSCDERDANKYGIYYYPDLYDRCQIDENDENINNSDVLFIGRGKDRIGEIVEIYRKLTEDGLKCKFYLVDVPGNERHLEGQIEYGDYMPYSEVLQYVKHTKCMLEILQKNADSETLRVFEALTYGKKMITNNEKMLYREYYRPEYIQVFKEADEIDSLFIKNEITVNYEKRYLERYKPYSFMRFIDDILSQ